MDDKQCVLVLIGADEGGKTEILGLPPSRDIAFAMHCRAVDGYRESTQSWRKLLLDVKRRGLNHAPDLAIGDGRLGSGQPCVRCLARLLSNAVGSTKSPMS